MKLLLTIFFICFHSSGGAVPEQSQTVAINFDYKAVGEQFVQQYYTLFPDAAQRHQLVNFYHPNESFMTFEGDERQGAPSIGEKISSLPFSKAAVSITKNDYQPMFDGGVLIYVLGQIKTDDDPTKPFVQTFVLKPEEDSFFIQHDIFRLVLQD